MGLQPSDFALGAHVTQQGYSKPHKELGEIADYQRTIVGGTPESGVKFADVFSDVVLLEGAFAAKLYFGEEKKILRSPHFQRKFAREVDQDIRRREKVRPRDIHFGALRRLRVGDESILQQVSARVRGAPYSLDRIAMRVECATAFLELEAVPGARISLGEARGLAGTMADRMRTGLRMAPPVILAAPTLAVLPNAPLPPVLPRVIASKSC
jgi:hypothetical protein